VIKNGNSYFFTRSKVFKLVPVDKLSIQIQTNFILKMHSKEQQINFEKNASSREKDFLRLIKNKLFLENRRSIQTKFLLKMHSKEQQMTYSKKN
jgi:hypothetical protein